MPAQPLFGISIIIGWSLLSSCTITRFKVDKKPLVQYFETNPTFRENHTGFLVYDAEEKSVLFDYNGHKHFTPASNTKLLTFYAAKKLLDDSIPSLSYCFLRDTLFFSGTGDPTLLYTHFEHNATLDFLRSFPYPLANVRKQMTDQRFGPGWAWDDYPYYFSTEKSPLPIYGNMVRFQKESTEDYVEVIPHHFESSLVVYQDTTSASFSLEREEFENSFRLTFHGEPLKLNETLPFLHSDELLIKLLSDTLGRRVFQREEFPGCRTKLYHSVPTDSVLKHILIESDNFLSEQMLLVMSSRFGDVLSSDSTIEFVMKHHFPELKNQIEWVDGSGLSRYNQMTPMAMVKILEKIYHEISMAELYELLPESGATGTLKTSFSGLKGKIHAKTGSMSHVYNLSGFLETNSGKTLLFSFMNNNFDVSFDELKKEMERVLAVFVNDAK